MLIWHTGERAEAVQVGTAEVNEPWHLQHGHYSYYSKTVVPSARKLALGLAGWISTAPSLDLAQGACSKSRRRGQRVAATCSYKDQVWWAKPCQQLATTIKGGITILLHILGAIMQLKEAWNISLVLCYCHLKYMPCTKLFWCISYDWAGYARA